MTEEQNKLAELSASDVEAARIALHAAIAMNEGFSDKWYEERWGYVDALCRAALRERAPATEAVRDEVLEEAAIRLDNIGWAAAPDRAEKASWRRAAQAVRALKGKGASQGVLHDKPLLRAHVGLAPEPSGEPSSEMVAIAYAITLLETERDWEKCLQYLRAVEDRLSPDEQKG